MHRSVMTTDSDELAVRRINERRRANAAGVQPQLGASFVARCVKHGQIEVLVHHGLSVGGKNDVAGWSAPANLFGAKIPKARSAGAGPRQEMAPLPTAAHVPRTTHILVPVATARTPPPPRLQTT